MGAVKTDPNNPCVTGIAAFYRAMSLYRQGEKDEARKLAIAGTATMKPPPKDENNPLADDAYYDDLILWLAYKEAKAMIGFDAAPPAKAENGTSSNASSRCGEPSARFRGDELADQVRLTISSQLGVPLDKLRDESRCVEDLGVRTGASQTPGGPPRESSERGRG